MTKEPQERIPNEIIKGLRAERGYTQIQLSSVSGVSETQIQKIETGKIKIENVTLKNAIALANALGVTVYDLMKQEEEQ